jgi:hypothetical protein
MAKNYNPWMLLVILLISINFSFSQSNHSVVFTGNSSDFNAVEKITGGDNVDYYVTFDETKMYFGAFRTNGETFTPQDYFTIYLDTDPQPNLIGYPGTGSTAGRTLNGRTPTFPYSANHTITIRNSGVAGESYHYIYKGNGWSNHGATGTNPTSYTQRTSSTALEIAIPKSQINSAKGIYFSMYMSNSNGFFGYGDAGYPISFSGNVSSGYFGGIGINATTVVPTEHTNTPILHTLPSGANPQPDGKYAHIDIDGNYYYYVEGDIELVAGGTATIAGGNALIVDGTFTNNGLITLQSTSTLYSSLIPTSVDGTGTIRYNRHVNRNGLGNQKDLISAPLTGQTFGAFAAANPNIVSNPSDRTQKGFGPFNKTTGDYETYDTVNNANTILTPAVGYRAAAVVVAPSTSGGPFTFTGDINTGVVSIPILNTNNEYALWNLIGNPYPSYISMKQFINDNLNELNPALFGIYGYTGHNPGVWETVNLASSGDRLIAPGQGFYVLAKTTGGTISFNPAIRAPGDTDDFILNRNAAQDSQASIRLTMTSGSKYYHTDIFFDIAGTLGFDLGYDSGVLGNHPFSIYSKLVENNNPEYNIPLAIQTLPYSILDSEVVVPIGIKATAGEQLTISGINTPYPLPLPYEVDVYFEDNIANTSTLLKNGDHIFTPDSDLSGSNRFSLRFTNSTLSVDSSHFDDLQIYSPYKSGHLIVKGQIYENSKVEIYDLNGRLLRNVVLYNNQSINRIDISGLSSGIYIVKINNTTGSKIKKIQVHQ